MSPAQAPPNAVEPGDWRGDSGTPRARCVLAPNPSPMTLEGTNTWILAEPGDPHCVVVDPGPDDESHLRAVADAVAEAGQRVARILLTHRHPDHAAGAERFAQLVGAQVAAQGPGRDDLADGQLLEVGGLQVGVLGTPGHTSDSVCFLVAADSALLTGDTILGWGTTMVAYPDGRLADYLTSLHRLRELTGAGAVELFLPAHGAVLPDADGSVHYYVEHRRERLDQVRAALADGVARDAQAVLEHVYADVPRALWPAAKRSVEAQLAYLRDA